MSAAGPAVAAQTMPADAGSAPAKATSVNTIALAQPAAEPLPAATPTIKNRAVEEVIITAQKREENLQDVPIAVQAFSGDALAARGIDDTTKLGQSVPALQFTSVQSFTFIYIRGVGTDNFIPSAEPSVAQYVDGIYVPQGSGTLNTISNVQRVEVLKGPQGTLFGRNSTGGAINIISEEPGDTYKASVELGGGNFNAHNAKVNVSGPVTDWLSAGIAWMDAYEESYYENVNYQIRPTKLSATRAKLVFKPLDHLTIGLTGYYSRQSSIGTFIGANTDPTLLGTALGIQPAPNTYTVDSDYRAGGSSGQKLIYTTTTWETPCIDVKVLGSAQYLPNEGRADFDGSKLPIASFDLNHGFQRAQSAELQLISNDRTPFAKNFQWVAGLYYIHSRAGFDPASLYLAPQGIESGLALANLEVPQFVQDLLDRLNAENTPLGNNGTGLSFYGKIGTDSYSAFAQGTYFINDWLDLTLGGRYQREKRYLTQSTAELRNFFADTDSTNTTHSTPLLSFDPDPETEQNFSPKIVLSARIDDGKMVYASYTKGFKSGTFNIANIYTPPNYIVPEKVQTYEIGAKLDMYGGLLRVNGAVFNNQISDLQSGFLSLLTGGAVRFLTVPKARTRGAEMDGTWLPMPDLNSGLVLTGNVAYIDAIYTDFPDGSGFDPTTGIYVTGVDFTGNEIVRNPKWSGGLGVVQALDFESGSLELGVDGYYNSGFYYDPYNTVKEKQYAIMNARASYLYKPANLRFSVYGRNVLDKQYNIQQFQTDFGIIHSLAAPRQYGLQLIWQF